MRTIVQRLLVATVCCIGGWVQAGPIPPDTFRVTGAMGETGDTVGSAVVFDTVNVLQGWSFGLCHDGANLGLVSATPSPLVMTINGGGMLGFLALETMPAGGDGVTMGVVIDLFGVNNLPPAMGNQILLLSYDLLGVPAGADINTDVCFCETLGNPVVATVAVVNGASIPPIQQCGTFTIGEPPMFAIQDFTCVGGPDNVDITWTATTMFDYYLIHRDGVFLAMLSGATLSYAEAMLPAGTYHYALIGVAFPDPMGSPVISVAECDVDVIPLAIDDMGINPTIGPYTGGTLVTITGIGFAPPAMDTTVTFDGITQASITIVNDNMITFVTQSTLTLGPVDVTVTNSNGTETVIDGFTYAWIRGDANSDGFINIADAIFNFSFLFEGGMTPPCRDAADFNDDGGINIADSIYLISFLFESGPLPPAPFPGAGFDPTGDPLDCLGVL